MDVEREFERFVETLGDAEPARDAHRRELREEVVAAAIEKKLDVVLMTYNFTMGDRMEPLLASLREAGLGVVAMKTQAGVYWDRDTKKNICP